MEFYGIFMDIYGYLRFAMRYHKLIPLMLKHYDREEIISHLVQSPVPNSRGLGQGTSNQETRVFLMEIWGFPPGFSVILEARFRWHQFGQIQRGKFTRIRNIHHSPC